jgi:hypothetical protein
VPAIEFWLVVLHLGLEAVVLRPPPAISRGHRAGRRSATAKSGPGPCIRCETSEHGENLPVGGSEHGDSIRERGRASSLSQLEESEAAQKEGFPLSQGDLQGSSCMEGLPLQLLCNIIAHKPRSGTHISWLEVLIELQSLVISKGA